MPARCSDASSRQASAKDTPVSTSAWVRPVSSVQKALTVDRAGRTRIRWRVSLSAARRSSTVSPISMISLTAPGGGWPSQQVASMSITLRRSGESVSMGAG